MYVCFLYLKMLQSCSRWKSPRLYSAQTCSKNLTNSSALTRVLVICTERLSISFHTVLFLLNRLMKTKKLARNSYTHGVVESRHQFERNADSIHALTHTITQLCSFFNYNSFSAFASFSLNQ